MAGFTLGTARQASLVAQTLKRLPAMQETRIQSLGWEDPLEKEMAIHSTTLAWKIPRTEERGRLQSTGSQSRTRLSNFTFCNYHWLPNIPQIFGSAFEVIAEASPKCLSALIHVPP